MKAVSPKTHNAALKQLNAYLRAHEMRPSKVRDMVLAQICNLPQPFTAEQLVTACREERISVGTVYNALNLFVLAQILQVHERQRGRSASEYELAVGTTVKMQMTCNKCGRVSEFHDKVIERLIKEKKYTNFNLHHFSLSIYGECKKCRRQNINNEPI